MRIPTSTYRIQFHSGFPFASAQKIVNYLAELGISDLYASPIFKARAGSTHGYDVVDPTHLNPELGTPEEFELLLSDLQSHNMGWLQDIVPNHMAYDSQNKWLMDVLENGADSEFFDFFDIEWNHAYESFKGRILAPLLGTYYGECLENGEIKLNYDETGLSIDYFGLKLPIRIESYTRFLTQNLGQLGRELGRRHPDFVKLLGVVYLIKNLPAEFKGRERYDQLAFVKGLLWELYTQNESVKEFFDNNIQFFNGEPGRPETFNLLDSILSEQFYRLSFWKVGAEEINYRRFFTVNELISVKVEEMKVLGRSHSLIERFVREGKFTGLRIDHIDGLYNPNDYLEKLREKVGDTYITAEKILELVGEDLPHHWPIQGTSGYDYLNYVNGLFCCCDREQEFQDIYSAFTGSNAPYHDLVTEKKHLIIEKNLLGDVDNLAQKLKHISGQTREGSDFTANGLKRVLTEVLALFPVYRTYTSSPDVRPEDITYIKETIEKAKGRVPLLVKELGYLEKLLLRQDESYLNEEQKADRHHFVMKFQQLTGPLMAKGVEDTLFYNYNRLISLNEVGGNPGSFGVTPDEFHEFNLRRSSHWLHSMNATATHDTKRGEDTRARINVLPELASEWEENIWTWSEMNRAKKTVIKDKPVPDTNDEYFLYQTLIGAFPFNESEFPQFVQRVKDYVIKAVREAKVYTAWLRPDSAYEEGYLNFVDRLLSTPESNDFLEKLRPFQQKIAEYGIFNSLSQILLKNTSPGVPDLYQGNELWDLSLVDPDNRRPVEYERRIGYLQEIKQKIKTDIPQLIKDLFATKEDGKIKMFLTYQLLQARKEHLELFQDGDYKPLMVKGKFSDRIIAFARIHQNKVAITLATRLLTKVIQPGELPLGKDIWEDTSIELPEGMPTAWKDAITLQDVKCDNTLYIGEALQHFPAALLIGT
ncbi:malto-oligosyltrehalose synthase [Floridanema aerugineum]|uniref:Malto-oligosyltrehalose synthase n=1 Tax=Floridaenema aerugineum BLCC-F46 TaxID=3153654 RepID=A0ABV4XFI4_9CYAN